MMFSPFPVRAREFGFAKQVRPSRTASPCSFSTLSLYLVLTRGIPPAFRYGVIVHIYTEFIGSHDDCVPMVFTAESPLARGCQ